MDKKFILTENLGFNWHKSWSIYLLIIIDLNQLTIIEYDIYIN